MTLLPHGADTPTVYDETFYQSQQDGSVRSAEIVVPIVLSLFPCHSVVDFGCGVGGWLREFERQGVSDYLGIDGDYVSRHLFKIPADRFRPTDLRDVSDLGRGFDLACSLEVAEHLPEDRARSFVAALVKAAPVVLFSAAIPFQDGTGHLNEQWQSYWAKLFGEHGYVTLDCIRPVSHSDSRVRWWYRQNILVFCLPDKCPSGCTAIENSYYLDRIDPVMLNNFATGPHSLRQGGETAAANFLDSAEIGRP
jgi:SAM-dependent methyltransferase